MTGLYSPSGTIKVGNTATPNENGGCQIDVNIPIVYQQLKTLIAQDFVSKEGLKTTLKENTAQRQDSNEGRATIPKNDYTRIKDLIKGDATVRMNTAQNGLDVYNNSGGKVGTLKWT